MAKLVGALFLVAVMCGYVGVQDVSYSVRTGASIRNGVEMLIIAAICAGLHAAGMIRLHRCSKQRW
jgi:hypothetical protein